MCNGENDGATIPPNYYMYGISMRMNESNKAYKPETSNQRKITITIFERRKLTKFAAFLPSVSTFRSKIRHIKNK